MTSNEIIKEMLGALEANIAYLQKSGSSQAILKNGSFIESVGEIFVYQFSLSAFQSLEIDSEVEIRIRDVSANGRAVALADDFIQLELDKFIGADIPEARLIVSNYHLLKLLMEKLKTVDTGESKLTDLSEKTFRIKPTISESNDELPNGNFFSLNESQLGAVKKVIRNEVTFIWGPPGTGKTKTIACIIEALLEKKLSVLLLSHTNVATDGALLKLLDQLNKSPHYLEGKILRIGEIQDRNLKSEYPLVDLKAVEEIVGKSIREKLKTVENELSAIDGRVLQIEFQLKAFVEYERFIKAKNEKENKLSIVLKAIEEAKRKVFDSRKWLFEVEEKITTYNQMGMFKRIFTSLNIDQLTISRVKANKEISENENKLAGLENTKNGIREEINGYVEHINNNFNNLDLNKKQELVEELEKIKAGLSALRTQRAELQKQLNEISAELIKGANVIATTLTKSYSSKPVTSREYDCVIVDEASMAPLPALWCASGLAKNKVVIVGDFYQLPPIAKHKVDPSSKSKEEVEKEERLVNQWLKKEIFERVEIVRSVETGIKPEWLEQLKIQYRMHPDIASVVNYLVYGRNSRKFALDSDISTEKIGVELLEKEPLPKAHIGIYDTSNNKTYPVQTDSGSYYNLFHAILSLRLAQKAIESGYDQIGIISPFRAQTNLIRRMVKDQNIEKNVMVDTVHRFQGYERELIIFDTTTGNRNKLLDDDKEGGDDSKLVNVAFSRAKQKLIMIVDKNRVEKEHSPSSLVKKFIGYCDINKHPTHTTSEILEKYNVTESSEKWLSKIFDPERLKTEAKDSELYDQKDFYKTFINDLLLAKKEVIIDSPYITTERTKTFLPVFEHLLKKGIRIILITRMTKEHTTGMRYQAEKEIDKFVEMGIVVLPFFGLQHRKLAIIDREILWEGSLNILSQKDSHEIMRRFKGKETAEQVIHFLKIDRNIGKLGENKLEKCEFCDDPCAWYWTDMGRFGIWKHCLIGNHKPGKPPKTESEINKQKDQVKKIRKQKKETNSEGVPICQIHQLPMVERKGRWGLFWGCPKYPKCKNTAKKPA